MLFPSPEGQTPSDPTKTRFLGVPRPKRPSPWLRHLPHHHALVCWIYRPSQSPFLGQQDWREALGLGSAVLRDTPLTALDSVSGAGLAVHGLYEAWQCLGTSLIRASGGHPPLSGAGQVGKWAPPVLPEGPPPRGSPCCCHRHQFGSCSVCPGAQSNPQSPGTDAPQADYILLEEPTAGR